MRLPDGRSWDDARETVADLMIDAVEAYAPGFRNSVNWVSPSLPLRDVVRLSGGHHSTAGRWT